MTVIPFKPKKEDNHPKYTMLETFHTLETQIEQLDIRIKSKEKKLQALSHWSNSESYKKQQKEIAALQREKALLIKTQQVIIEELKKEE